METPNSGGSVFKDSCILRSKLIHWLKTASGQVTSESPVTALDLYGNKVSCQSYSSHEYGMMAFIIPFLFSLSNSLSKAKFLVWEVYAYSVEEILGNFIDIML